MKTLLDLSTLTWSLTGWRPFAWKLRKSAETGGFLLPDFGPYPAALPGSVQENLRRAGVIPDWHIGRNSLAIEWVEHRQWMFSASLPTLTDAGDMDVVFYADTLDCCGWLLLDGSVIGEFGGAHTPVRLDLGRALTRSGAHELAIVFDLPPEGQGQLGYTSRAREMKPRYSFSWDWCVRVIPIGAGGRLALETSTAGTLWLAGTTTELSVDLENGAVTCLFEGDEAAGLAEIELSLTCAGRAVTSSRTRLPRGTKRITLPVNKPALWWPRGEGAQTLHELTVSVSHGGCLSSVVRRTVGFKHLEWRPCLGAPAHALPWVCAVNGRPIFLQGVNWTPVRMCYLDTTHEETNRLVGIYRNLGCNLLRVWGGGYLESPEFYSACDHAGLLVWQEFPLSSSGMDSNPPSDAAFVDELCTVARHFIRSRQHHACLLQWCGGNELQIEETVQGVTRRNPLDLKHPTLAALAQLVAAEDPGHRFLPTSPFGPRFHSSREEFGQGLHHEVHGPWGLDGYPNPGEWENYWRDDDALFRGETGVGGASSLDLILRHAGGEAVWPPSNALWRHSSGWWTQWDRLGERFAGLAPDEALAAYVDYTRREQAEKLAGAVRAKKAQFPRCGGFLIWMGHDAFPCLANTSLVEFDHALKPAALAVAEVFHAPAGLAFNIR